jgi:hypothetical protein
MVTLQFDGVKPGKHRKRTDCPLAAAVPLRAHVEGTRWTRRTRRSPVLAAGRVRGGAVLVA